MNINHGGLSTFDDGEDLDICRQRSSLYFRIILQYCEIENGTLCKWKTLYKQVGDRGKGQ